MKLHLLTAFVAVIGFSACGKPSVSTPNPAPNPGPPPTITRTANRCGEVSLRERKLSYCYEDRVGQASGPRAQINVIYYLHGLGGKADDLFRGEGLFVFDTLAHMLGPEMPVVVGISLGAEDVFGDETREIVDDGLPQLERLIAPGKAIRRIAMGGSMGGHNSLRLAAEVPRGFAAVAAVCAALATFNGHNPAEVADYVERNKAVLDRGFFERALVIYKRELPSTESWAANNPFTYLGRGVYDALPIFLSVGREDTLGFVEGSREFKRRADLRAGTSVDYRETRGPHCTFDVPAFFGFVYGQVRGN